MQYRTLEFIPVDEPAWVEELHMILVGHALEGWRFVGSVTREIAREQPGDLRGMVVSIQSTALVFKKES